MVAYKELSPPSRTNCMNCGSNHLEKFIDLGMQPNGNNFPEVGQENKEIRFPISMDVCHDCWQVQIDEFPPQEFLFTNHPYITGINVPVVDHFERLSKHLIESLNLAPNSLILDIGCNDGTLLRCFEERGMRTLGVDPGRLTGKLAKEKGTIVFETFWNKETGQALRKLNLFPDLITATAVFYHLPDLHDFIEGLKAVFSKNTIFVIQCVNLRDLIEKNQFDHFYHEHSCIHAIKPLKRLFDTHQMRLLNVEFVDIHGGSFVLYIGLASHPIKTKPSIEAAIRREIKIGLQNISTYREFANRAELNANKLRQLLKEIKGKQKSVFALGAPVKGNTLLNYARITPDLVECATEINQFKIGKLTPGTHIPVVHENDIDKDPDYYLILSWNFLDYFIGKYKPFLLNGGKFIVPVPEVRILGFEVAKKDSI